MVEGGRGANHVPSLAPCATVLSKAIGRVNGCVIPRTMGRGNGRVNGCVIGRLKKKRSNLNSIIFCVFGYGGARQS